VSPPGGREVAERRFGGPELTIHCAIDHLAGHSSLGRIELLLGGATFGDFDQPCVLAGVATDLDVNLFESESRKDLALAALDPRQALDRVYAAVYGADASDEDAFWHRRLVWLEGREPYDGFRSIQLAVPAGRLTVWDSTAGGFHQALVGETTYRETILEWLAWLELRGVGSWDAPNCAACAWSGAQVRRSTYARLKRRLERRAK
jgi:hypothetical protein